MTYPQQGGCQQQGGHGPGATVLLAGRHLGQLQPIAEELVTNVGSELRGPARA